MKKLNILFLIVAVMFSTSCASLYKTMYAPSEVKAVNGDLQVSYKAGAYEVVRDNSSSKNLRIEEQKTTTSIIYQYKTPNGEWHWYLDRDYNEQKNTLFWAGDIHYIQLNSKVEKIEPYGDMQADNKYTYAIKDESSGEVIKMTVRPWKKGYGYFVILAGDNHTIIYSVPINNVFFW